MKHSARRALALALTLSMVSISSLSLLAVSQTSIKAPRSSSQGEALSGHLAVAKTYERSGQFQKAESEYVLAAASENPQVRAEALAGVNRLLVWAGTSDLAVARMYERLERWPEAEIYYVKASQTALSQADRSSALEGIERVKKNSGSWLSTSLEQTEGLVQGGTLLLRLAMLIIVIFAFVRFVQALLRTARSTRIHQFEGEEDFTKLVKSAFPAVRAKVSMTLVGSKTIRLPEAVSNTYPFVPLHVDDYLPDEALEFGDLKIPSLASLVRIFVKPRLEIDGGIFPSDSSTRFIYAHVWRNRFFGTKLETIVAARIPALDLNCAELEIFVYDVYLKSFDALKRYARS